MVRIKKDKTIRSKAVLIILTFIMAIGSGTASVWNSQYSTGTSTVIQYGTVFNNLNLNTIIY